jgi:hypothetical protein
MATKNKKRHRAPRTAKQQFVVGRLVENGGSGKTETITAIMLAAGYSPATAKTPQKVTESLGFQELLEEVMPDNELADIHRGLLQARKLDHMVFPLGPKDEDDPNFSGANPNENQVEKAGVHVERTTLSDQEITRLIADVGGTVRRIVHGDTARHVYFWAPNDKARHDALKLAYDLKGRLGKRDPNDLPPGGNTYNTFIQQNNLNPNTPAAKSIIDVSLDALMEATKRKVIDNEPDAETVQTVPPTREEG